MPRSRLRLIAALQRESPITLAREALWRARRHWRRLHFKRRAESGICPVVYRSVGYYRLPSVELHGYRLDEHSAQTILRFADAISRGQYPCFACAPAQLGFPPQWNLDFVSSLSWPRALSETLQVVRHDGSDVKVPWDLSRLQFLPILGKAFRLTGEERYKVAGRELLSHWIEQNPPGIGVNWTIAMEVALRAISVCFFLELVTPPAAALDPSWREVTTSLWQHLIFIEAHNEFSHFFRGNHYLSNLVGIFCLSSFLRGPGMDRRQRSCHALLEKEILLQIYPDGGDYEASSGYHLLNLQMFTTAFLLMRRQKTPPSPEFSARLRGMYRFIAALADQRGRVPHIGDCDDGRVELLSDDLDQMFSENLDDRHSLNVSGVLGVGEALFGEKYCGHQKDAVWYACDPLPAEFQSEQIAARPIVFFPDFGVAVARRGSFQVTFLAMPNGILGKGTHTHNDKLSVLVQLNGEELFADSGTGCYTRNAQQRNRFRSTVAHNTIQIDGEEQNRFSVAPEAVFLMSDDAHVTPIETEHSTESVLQSASHDGYSRLGVSHVRTVKLSSQSLLTLEDRLVGTGSHRFEMRFHLPSQWRVEILQGAGQEVMCHIQGTSTAAELRCQAPVDLRLACLPTEISRAYGLVTGASVIVIAGNFHTSLRLFSFISAKA